MKLQNKKTGEIGEITANDFNKGIFCVSQPGHSDVYYCSLAKLCEEWTDYEEPEKIWYIGCYGDVFCESSKDKSFHKEELGNYFSSREEAEKAVEKLKAWKRIKEAGAEFDGWEGYGDSIEIRLLASGGDIQTDDLTFIFGGEDE